VKSIRSKHALKGIQLAIVTSTGCRISANATGTGM
jgi:hypothetical protein